MVSLQPNPLKLKNNSFLDHLEDHAQDVESILNEILPPPITRLHEAMRYSVLAGGKRLRSYLVSASSHLFDVPSREALQVGAALELIHAYSLVHDDLPCMDNAETRRGKPSCHIAFGEATATLVGDALIPLAFQTLASLKVDSEIRLELTKELAQAIGSFGLVAGQMMDLNQEGRRDTVEALLEQQRLKTGVLFAFATEAGAILGKTSPEIRKALQSYGLFFGEAFQMMDDWLDGHGDEESIGKPCDQDASKLTFLNLCGARLLQEKAKNAVEKAIETLSPFQEKACLLKAAAEYVLYRQK